MGVGRWARDYDKCVECGGTNRVHAGHGLCTCCYKRMRFGTKRRYNRLGLGKRLQGRSKG